MLKKLYLIALIFSTSFFASAQSTTSFRENTTNTNAWFMYFGNHKFSKSLGLHAEVQLRRNDVIQNSQQLLLRTGLDYHTAQVRYTFGYAFVETYPYGDYPVANAFPEHRMWQQALISNGIGRVKLSHRYRLEQRWLGNSITGEFENGRYENRMRYMVRANIPLKGKTIEPKTFYLGFYDEIFVNFGKEVAYNIFDQNRLYGALGYHLGKIGRIEVGYLYQLVQQRRLLLTTTPPRTIMENNHTIQVALINDISFYKDKEK